MPLEKLDSIQEAAVKCMDRDVLCDSKAGSGKTRILMNRCLYLMDNGVKPSEILLITFTNKAAKEMMTRIQALSPYGKDILCGTFHYIAMKYIRQYADVLGFDENFTILSPEDCVRVMKTTMKTYDLLNPDEEILDNDKFKYKKFYNAYSASRNHHIPFKDYVLEKCELTFGEADIAEKIAEQYQATKKASNTMDFDDLLDFFAELLRDPALNDKIAGRFKHILVDEYQDINYIQNAIIYNLRGTDRNLFVVGDPYQCIYGFRGSKIEYIRDFAENFDASVFHVQNNYRSIQPILNAASSATNGKAVLRSQVPGNLRPSCHYTNNNIEQAEFAIRQVKALIDKGESPDQIAILLRSTMAVHLLEQNLKKLKIPYVTRAGFAYFEKSHIKDILMFLSLICNPLNKEALKRTFALFDGFGEKTIQKCTDHIVDNKLSIAEFADEVETGKFKLGKKAKEGTAVMAKAYKSASRSGIRPKMRIAYFVNEFYNNYLLSNYPDDYEQRYADIVALVDMAGNYYDLQSFINESIVDTSIDDDGGKNKGPKVVISTIHRAKGLEWDNCIICNLGPNFKMSYSTSDDDDEFEVPEDMRLFYVAVTRARKRLILLANYDELYKKSRLTLSHLIPKCESCCNRI